MKIEKLDRDRAPVRKITISFTPEELLYIHDLIGRAPQGDAGQEMYQNLSGLVIRENLE